MKAMTFIPQSDSERGIWLNNFTIKLPGYATVLGITAAEITSVQKDNAMYSYVMNALDIYKQMAITMTSYKNLLRHSSGQPNIGGVPVMPTLTAAPPAVPEGIFDRISKLAKRIKASPAYTEAIGSDLGIIAATQTVNTDTLQPNLTVKLEGGKPRIRCTQGKADAIDLWSDRKDGNGFVLVGRLTKTDYIDTTALPANISLAEWEYKAIYVIDNEHVGIVSDVKKVVVKRI
ncbi:MAG: hypothetical protein K0S33_2841 [Bacteroidetes bacterium]|jgi:hypothetical protein|nr:hypothetical protein [Bacteroidota bacterium]